MSTPHDRLFKELLTTFLPEFLELFLPDIYAVLESTELLEVNKELFGPDEEAFGQEADIVVRARFRPGATPDKEAFFLIHIEHQSSRDYDMSERMFDYFVRLYYKYHLKTYGVLICSYDSPKDAEPKNYRMTIVTRPIVDYNYEVIQLNRMDWRDYRNHLNPTASALMSKMGVAEEDQVKVKLACYKILTGLKLNRRQFELVSNFVETYLPFQGEKQQEFEVEIEREYGARIRKKAMDAKLKAIIQEIAEERVFIRGEAQGKAQGIALGEADLLMDLLSDKLGPFDSSVQQRVRTLDATQKRALGKAAFGFDQQQDVIDWLNRLP